MPSSLTPRQITWARRWMTLVILGLLVFVVGINPDLIGMNRSRVIGFIQMGVWLSGLGVLLLGAALTVRVVRNGRPMSLRAEVGTRLIATGYVISAAASLADFLAIGSHRLPWVYLGPLQVAGLAGGVVISLLGVLLYWPRTPKPPSEPESA
ncbi:MAG: hypothetical protein FJZ97_03710 [Chloroflexi bacterium]|nr:hypothetical protein [Chloroflexota bacterium]